MDEKIEKLVPKLIMRNFEVHCCETADDAAILAADMIGKDDTVAWGGSKTVAQTGLLDLLQKKGCNLLDRDTAETPEERADLMRRGLLSDVFLMSSNAVSEDGILVNIDGMGNRVAAMCYGPKNVIMIIGKNKLCGTIDEAEARVHNVAAVKNAERFGLTKTGCSKGKCIDCLSEECMCSYVVKTRRSKVPGRIKIILVNEDLGF